MDLFGYTVEIHWRELFGKKFKAFLVTSALFGVSSVYLYIRSGQFNLFVLNKSFADAATMLVGIVLLLGPLSRLFDAYDHALKYRKVLGVSAFILALLHGAVSLFFLQEAFTLEEYLSDGLVPFLFGLSALLIFSLLTISSIKRFTNKMGYQRWWKFQYWGVRISFLAITGHVFIMKFPRWLTWYREGAGSGIPHPEWPDLSILIAWFMAFVIALRAAEFINARLGKVVWYLFVFLLPAVYIITFFWGVRFAK